MAYVLLVDQVERRAATDRLVVATYQAAGSDATLPDIDEARERLDAALVAEPAAVDSERTELLTALGLRGR